jgi:hypothetical protein
MSGLLILRLYFEYLTTNEQINYLEFNNGMKLTLQSSTELLPKKFVPGHVLTFPVLFVLFPMIMSNQ